LVSHRNRPHLRLELEADRGGELGELAAANKSARARSGLLGHAAVTTLAKPTTASLWRRGDEVAIAVATSADG
jgi:hypothetical protein